jgi:lysozyme
MATDAPFTIVDVGPSQGYPDWAAMAASGQGNTPGLRVDGVYLKAAEGASGPGSSVPTFAKNAAGLVAAGLPFGAYFFLSPFSEAQAQADHFLDTIKDSGHALPPMIDVERSVGAAGKFPAIDTLLKFLAAVEDALDVIPLIYTADWVAAPMGMGRYPELRRCGLWVASYTQSDPVPFKPWGAWSDPDGGVVGWQYTGKGTAPGIHNSFDLSRFKVVPTWVCSATDPPPPTQPTGT